MQACGGHDPVAHRLELLEAVALQNLLHLGEERVERFDHLARTVLTAPLGEAHHVCKHHHRVVDVAGRDGASGAQFIGSRCRQHQIEHPVGLVLLGPSELYRATERKLGLHTGAEHSGRDGFEHIVHGAGCEASLLVLHRRASGKEHHRRLFAPSRRAELPADRVTVHVGHLDIEQNQVGRRSLCQRECTSAAGRKAHVVPVGEELPDDGEDCGLVVYDKNAGAVVWGGALHVFPPRLRQQMRSCRALLEQ